MEKDGRIGVRRKSSKRRRTRSAFSKAVADYLASDSYMYAPLVEPHDSAPPAPVRSPSTTDKAAPVPQLQKKMGK